MAKELVPVNYDSINIINDEQYDDLLYIYAEEVYKKEDAQDAYSFLSNALAIEYFPDVTFHNLLEQYFEAQGKDIEDEVRGYYPYKRGFLMTHGIGYAWESTDLFGDSSNGKNNFEAWLKEKGFELV